MMTNEYHSCAQTADQDSWHARPFSIRIFCPDGNPVGLRIISKSFAISSSI